MMEHFNLFLVKQSVKNTYVAPYVKSWSKAHSGLAINSVCKIVNLHPCDISVCDYVQVM